MVIGNEAVWSRLSDPDHDLVPRLLGMDLLRLGLERGDTARQALEVVTGLLEQHGQGGQCSDIVPDFSYHNSFLIADQREAWVLETADRSVDVNVRHQSYLRMSCSRLWAAEKVESGVRNISNCLSIRDKIDLHSSDLLQVSRERGWWDGEKIFDWSEVMGGQVRGSLSSGDRRWQCGRRLLQESSSESQFRVRDMMQVLRDEESGINRPTGDFPTAASQVSSLGSSSLRPGHWFTASPDPDNAVFKPFVFGSNISDITNKTRSPEGVALQPGEREHILWKSVKRNRLDKKKIERLEETSVKVCDEVRMKSDGDDIENIFNNFVESELSERDLCSK